MVRFLGHAIQHAGEHELQSPRAMTASSGMATRTAGTSAAVTASVRIRMTIYPERPVVPAPGPSVVLAAFATVTTVGGGELETERYIRMRLSTAKVR
jgi:hypothetical protein